MFNNLIESSSHKREFKRRGSFFLFTVAGYVLLFTAGAVASVYAYDAHLDEQAEITILTFAPPEPAVPVPAAAIPRNSAPRSNDNSRNPVPSAPILYENPGSPRTPPQGISTEPVKFPPAGPGTKQGPYNNPLGGGSSGSGEIGTGGTGSNTSVDVGVPPPAAAVPTPAPPKKILVSPKILNSVALSLPIPVYPEMAKRIHVVGSVSVQVLIDETGKVISAKAVSGHAMLTQVSVQAAQRARFSPTMLGDTPVKVSGVIVYNFVLN